MDINRKLNVIQEMRREQIRREREIYYPEYRRGIWDKKAEENEGKTLFLHFRLRLLIAILLFFCFFMMEQRMIKIGEIGYMEIEQYIGENCYFSHISQLMRKK